jgi:hypothetical protein
MIELLFIAQMQAQLEQEQEKRWWEEYKKADPAMQKIMLELKEKRRLEAIEERRHRENIRAQEKIADAIRSTSFWRF